MPNPQEIDQETREALRALGFEPAGHRNDSNFVRYTHDFGSLFVWRPGRWPHNHDQWLADLNIEYDALFSGAGQLFDDPISAAVWLNVEASHG